MRASRHRQMPLHDGAQLFGVDIARQRLEQDRLAVDLARELALWIEDERSAVGHARTEVVTGRAEDRHQAAGHVLAAMVADSLDDSRCAAIADAEALADTTCGEQTAPGCSVEDGVAGDRLRGLEGSHGGRADGDLAAGHPFPDVVVGLTFEFESHAVDDERAEALASTPAKPDRNGAFRQTPRMLDGD